MAVRGAGITILSGGVGLMVQVLSAVVLGRLLRPTDFGLVTMVTTFSLLLMNAPANAFIDSILQRKEVTEALASTLFWMNLAIYAVLTVAFALLAPLVARFFGEPQVRAITVAMSATIFLTGMSIIH